MAPPPPGSRHPRRHPFSLRPNRGELGSFVAAHEAGSGFNPLCISGLRSEQLVSFGLVSKDRRTGSRGMGGWGPAGSGRRAPSGTRLGTGASPSRLRPSHAGLLPTTRTMPFVRRYSLTWEAEPPRTPGSRNGPDSRPCADFWLSPRPSSSWSSPPLSGPAAHDSFSVHRIMKDHPRSGATLHINFMRYISRFATRRRAFPYPVVVATGLPARYGFSHMVTIDRSMLADTQCHEYPGACVDGR